MSCVGLYSTILSGDISPKPEVLGVRLVFVNVVVLPCFFTCCVFCNDFIFFLWPVESCDLPHKMCPCDTC